MSFERLHPIRRLPSHRAARTLAPLVTAMALMATAASVTVSSAAAPDPTKCYQTRVTSGTAAFQARSVLVADRIGAVTTDARTVRTLCNPVDVSGQGIVDRSAHLLCYGTLEARQLTRPLPDYQVTDQLGSLTLSLVKPERLCLPAEKNGAPSALGGGGFRCYKARVKGGTPAFAPVSVTLADQLESRPASVTKPVLLCLATSVDGVAAPDPDAALACYRLTDLSTDPPTPRRDVTTDDAFGPLAVTARPRSTSLCFPALVQPPSGP